MLEEANNDNNVDILTYKEIKMYRTLYAIASIVTPVFVYLWTHFQSNLGIISIAGSVLLVYYITIYLLSHKNKYIIKHLHYFLYGSYYLVSIFAVYLGYINRFSGEYSLLLMLVIFYIILTFNKLSHLIYYLITTMILLSGTLFISQLQTNDTSSIIIGASFMVFSIIAILNLYLRIGLQKELKDSYKDYQSLLDNSPDGILVHQNMKIVYANSLAMKMFNKNSKEEFIGKSILDIVHSSQRKEIKTDSLSFMKRRVNDSSERRILLPNNELVELDTASSITTYQGREAVMITCKEISGRKDIERKLIEAEYKYRSLVEGSLAGVYIYQNKKVIHTNPYIEKLLGYSSNEISNTDLLDLIFIDDRNKVIDIIRKLENGAKDAFDEVRIVNKNGNIIHVQFSVMSTIYNGVPALTGTLIDITQRKIAEAQINHMAHHDSLTGLPNRYYLNDFLKKSIEECKDSEFGLSLMFIDLDQFKVVNDTMGHDFGDILLQQATDRLNKSMRVNDFIARLGGDEFVIVLKDISIDEITKVAQRIINEFLTPFNINNNDVCTSPSIGISMCPWDANDAETLMKYGDTAMYRAKEQGRNTYMFYCEELNEHVM